MKVIEPQLHFDILKINQTKLTINPFRQLAEAWGGC